MFVKLKEIINKIIIRFFYLYKTFLFLSFIKFEIME